MSVSANRQRVLNALTGGPPRGFESVGPLGKTVPELAEQLGLSEPEVRQTVAELWERGLVRSSPRDRLMRGRDPAAPCGRELADGRACARRAGHAPPCRAN